MDFLSCLVVVMALTGKTQLSLILCLAPENGDFHGIPCDVKGVINSNQLSPFEAKVGCFLVSISC